MFDRPNKELARLVGSALPGLPMTGETGKAIEQIVGRTGVAIVGLQGAARVQAEGMQQTVNLVDLARELAGDDPVKAALLVEQVKAYARRASRVSNTILGW